MSDWFQADDTKPEDGDYVIVWSAYGPRFAIYNKATDEHREQWFCRHDEESFELRNVEYWQKCYIEEPNVHRVERKPQK